VTKKEVKFSRWAGRKRGKVLAFRPRINQQNQGPAGRPHRAGGDGEGHLHGLPRSGAGILGGSASGEAALFTVGAAERCPEERQQLTGLEKKWLLPTKCLLSMFFEPL